MGAVIHIILEYLLNPQNIDCGKCRRTLAVTFKSGHLNIDAIGIRAPHISFCTIHRWHRIVCASPDCHSCESCRICVVSRCNNDNSVMISTNPRSPKRQKLSPAMSAQSEPDELKSDSWDDIDINDIDYHLLKCYKL